MAKSKTPSSAAETQTALFEKQTNDSNAAPATGATNAAEQTWVLHQLEVFNWGPFAGMHRAEFDPAGTAIIGPTGSGKTTLVDALMTLLVRQPRYNLASTGGHESDRTLLSYVRGYLSGDGAGGREEVARPNKTFTGICASYRAGDQTLRLASLLWTDGNSNAATDLKRRWIFSQADDQSLERWLQTLNEDGIRELMKSGRETARLRIFDSKKAYLSHTRKFFDVGTNAFTLLNRAAGLKQLNSIDEIFRDLVLDDNTAFDRAIEVAGEFDNLAGIHGELETARRQQASLLPIKTAAAKLEKTREKKRHAETLNRILPVWFAMASEQAWKRNLESIATRVEAVQTELKDAESSRDDCKARVDTLQQKYLELGGNVIDGLRETIEAQTTIVRQRQSKVNDYLNLVRVLNLDPELSEPALKQNQHAVAQRRTSVQTQRDDKKTTLLEELSRKREAESTAQQIESELETVKSSPGSNIRAGHQTFRADLARQLNVAENDLPFLAELVEIKADEKPWRGAIERAIGSERLRILVAEDHLPAALQWVNRRDNRLHVRLQKAAKNEPQAHFHADGFTQKLNFAPHPMQQTVRRLLGARDLHCVASADALRTTEHALTIQGMMSGRKGRYEKQDQRRLSEGWMTGFDNKDQLESLEQQLRQQAAAIGKSEARASQLTGELDEFDSQLKLMDLLAEETFEKIDLQTVAVDLKRSEDRLQELLDPDSDASKAKATFDRQQIELNVFNQEISGHIKTIAKLEQQQTDSERSLQKAVARQGDGLAKKEADLAGQKLPLASFENADELDDAERAARKKIEQRLSELQSQVATQEKSLVRLMATAKGIDTGALTDVGTELIDVAAYLDRLQVLTDEALPEKLKRFKTYLTQSSDQGVTQLLAKITEEVGLIEDRISELNRTLLKVDFRSGRYLQLKPQRIKHERLRSLETAQRRLRSGALKDDEGDSHYKALREVIEILREAGQQRRLVGSRALLDPRYRLEFFVVEVDRTTGESSPPRTGSQSGSGGEKELMASHILTASLSYALCPAAADHPLYGTVILDEAFSKSSPSAATRIIKALEVFGLYPIFVTPNKEIGLLKQHTRKVICVQRPQKKATLASISWEKLEGLAKSR
jgi:uncharacterized protein YPO0396